MISGVVIGTRYRDDTSNFTSVFCKNTHVGVWRKRNRDVVSDNDSDKNIDDAVYDILIVDLLMLESPKLFHLTRLDDPEYNKNTIKFVYRVYSEYADESFAFPSIDDLDIVSFDSPRRFVESLMNQEMYGLEAMVKIIYKMYPCLNPKITMISDLMKYGKLYKTINSKFLNKGIEFVSRNVSGDIIMGHLMKARTAVNLTGEVPYIDIKTLMWELFQIETVMAPTMKSKGITFDLPEIQENEDERSRQCILIENVRSLDLHLSVSSKRNDGRKIVHLTTCGDELESLDVSELRQIHQYLASSTMSSQISELDRYARNNYIDTIMMKIADQVAKRSDKTARQRRRKYRKSNSDDRNSDNDEEYMSVSYRTAS